MFKKLLLKLVVNNLHRAAQAGDTNSLRAFIAKGQDVNGLDKNNTTPLFWAAFSKDLEVARTLVQHGANVNHIGPGGTTPLYNALHKKNEELAFWLLEQGANPLAADTNGNTMLHLACMQDMDSVATVLLKKGADANALNASGQSPLTLNILNQQKLSIEVKRHVSGSCILQLLEAGADYNPIPRLDISLAEFLAENAAPDSRLHDELRGFIQQTDNESLRTYIAEAIGLPLDGDMPDPACHTETVAKDGQSEQQESCAVNGDAPDLSCHTEAVEKDGQSGQPEYRTVLTTLYASVDDPAEMPDVLAACLEEYRTERAGNDLLVYPKFFEKTPVRCRVDIRTEEQSADDFTGGLYGHLSQSAFRSEEYRETMLALLYCSNVIFRFEADAYTPQTERILDVPTTLARRYGAFSYDHGSACAHAFLDGEMPQYYNGVIYSDDNTGGRESPVTALLRVSEKEYTKRCGEEGTFKAVMDRQREVEARLAAIPKNGLLESLFNEGEYDRIIEIVEAMPESERDCEVAASLGMAWYGRSYLYPNAAHMRQKALDCILAAREEGENNAYWNYALGYVQYIFYPDLAAKHYQRAKDLGFDVSESSIKSREEQAARYVAYARRREESVDGSSINGGNSGEPFAGFDFTGFWRDSEYVRDNYVFDPPSDEVIAEVESALGYKLPASYIWLMKRQNGGAPAKSFHPSEEPTSWSDDGATITGIYAIGFERDYTLCGKLGSRFRIEGWCYPDIGVYFGYTETAGHDMIALDYRHCGPEGEPEVVHVGEDDHFKITWLAKDFESFIRGLRDRDEEDE